MKTVFVRSEVVARDTVAFSFKKPNSYQYIPGQFIELYLPHKNYDDRGEKRWFTLSSSPNEKYLTITTKNSNKPSSFKKLLFNLKIDDTIHISEPMGDFVLPRNSDKPLLFVAGGIGVTPFRSMCTSLNTTSSRKINMIYAAESNEYFAYTNQLNQKTSLKKIVGKLTSDVIMETAKSLDNPIIYLSGPEEMVQDLYDQLKTAFSQSQLLCDYFPNYP